MPPRRGGPILNPGLTWDQAIMAAKFGLIKPIRQDIVSWSEFPGLKEMQEKVQPET
jgi:hypothetical protein